MNNMDVFINASQLKRAIPPVDLHIHTDYSDGRSTIREYVEKAEVAGLKSLCFTDHVDFTTAWHGSYLKEISLIQNSSDDIRIFNGIEVRAKDLEGSLNAPESIIKNAEIVIGVVHSIPGKDGKGKHKPGEFSADRLLDIEFEVSLKLLDNEEVSVLGHPMSNYEKLYGIVPRAYYKEIISKARKNGKAVEISAKYKNDFRGFLNICLELDPLISLGSDAHSVEELGRVISILKEEMLRETI